MLLEKLTNATGPSGYEGDIRNIIKEELLKFVDELTIDRMGNLIVHKKGLGKKVVIDAHMDEVGFIITGYNEDGSLKFSPLGGINSKVIPAKVVHIGKAKVVGVIGLKPIHLQSQKERENNISYSECCIDIGANSKEEAKKVVSLGEYVVFNTKFDYFGDGLVKGKALDDRVGCSILIEILKENYNCDLYGVFNVQEEIGERGTFISSYNIQPDLAIILEGTVCTDMPNVPKHCRVTEINKGPVISIIDKTSLFNKDVINHLIKVAEANKIPYQFMKSTAGENNAGAIYMSGEGAKVATVSVPCRYIHSSISVCSLSDYKNTKKLVENYLKEI